MNFKQLKILSLALSLPGFIALVGYGYYFVTKNHFLDNMSAAVIFGIILLLYLIFFIYTVSAKKNYND